MTETADRAGQCPRVLEEVDLFAPGAQEHWFEAYKILHEQAPVLKIPGEGEQPGSDAFIITTYEDIARIVRDPDTFPIRFDQGDSNLEREIIREQGFADTVDAQRSLRPDIEQHKQHRHQLTDPWVGTGAERHTEMITRVTHELIDGWIDKGEVELVKEFAAPLPQTVITNILGFPLEDMPMLRKWEEAQVHRFVYGTTHKNILTPDEERENAATLVEFHRYIHDQIDRKRLHPADDMTSFLTEVRYGDEQRPLSDGEIVAVVYGMHIGGNETTQYALTAQAQLLAENPDLVAQLRADRGKVRVFVEEALRLYAPTQGLSTRRVAQDVTFQGVAVPRGSLLHLRYGAGNRDESEFARADTVDLDRRKPARHLTFSQGPRTCPGAGLSRLEQNIAVNVLLDRLDDLRLEPGRNDLKHQPGIMLGLWNLYLSFSPRSQS
jgi:cytochrome P450